MSDVFSSVKRSEVMSGIRGKGNKSTELALAAVMRKAGITGWRRHVAFRLILSDAESRIRGGQLRRSLIRPDFTFRRERLVVFVDGCFWHQCPIHSKMPKENAEFWFKKLTANTVRDKATDIALMKKGWRVLRIWEHELKVETCLVDKLRHHLAVHSR